MANGALVAQLTVPTGGWSVELTVTAVGTFTVTVAAGTYYPSELIAAFDTALDAASGADGAFSFSSDTGENGSSLVSVFHTVQTFSLVWTSTDLRDALGFTGDLTPAASFFTSTQQLRGVWLPDCVMMAAYGPNDPGHTKSDRRGSMSPRGDIWATKYTSRVVLPFVRWSHVSKGRARISAEATGAVPIVGSSFEQWWRWTHNAEVSYFSVAPQVRLIWDAGTPGTYHTYRLSEGDSTDMPRVVEDWNGLYTIELRNLIRVPGT